MSKYPSNWIEIDCVVVSIDHPTRECRSHCAISLSRNGLGAPSTPTALDPKYNSSPSASRKSQEETIIGCGQRGRTTKSGRQVILLNALCPVYDAESLKYSHVWLFEGEEGGKWIQDLEKALVSSSVEVSTTAASSPGNSTADGVSDSRDFKKTRFK
jgi:hypothetical protein